MNAIVKFITVILLISSIVHTYEAQAMSCRRHSAMDPDIKQSIATEKYSPFRAMTWASFGGVLVSSRVFWQRDENDETRALKDARGFAIGTWLVSGMMAAMTSSCSINDEARKGAGPVSKSDVEIKRMRGRRGAFYFFHTLNAAPALYLAVVSERDDRWAWAALAGAIPFLTDFASRYIFESDDVSPWTLTGDILENPSRDPVPALAIRFAW